MTAFWGSSHFLRPVTAPHFQHALRLLLRPALCLLLCLALVFAPAAPALAITVTSNADSGANSLRQAITDTGATDQIIDFTLGAGNTIRLSSSLPQITVDKNNLTIDGTNGDLGVIIDGGGSSQIFNLALGVSAITLHNLTLQNGSASSVGGAICALGALSITTGAGGMTFSDNSASLSGSGGGAIYANRALTITTGGGGMTFSGNSATGFSGMGGAIYANDTLTITTGAGGMTFSGNSATGYSGKGGAIYANRALTITTGAGGMTFSGNSATDGSGGAIYANGALTLGKGVTFGLKGDDTTGNSANSGGAITFSNSANTLDATAGHVGFYHNKATYDGGAIYADGALTITTGAGGMTFSGNSATGYSGKGGAIYARGALSITTGADGMTFSGNSATDGSGGAIYADGALTITTGADGMTFSGNSATYQGGAIYANGALTLGKGVTFGLKGDDTTGNNANYGGAISFSANANTLDATAGHVGFYHNKATYNGGAIHANDALTITTGAGGMTFSGNSTTDGSGGGGGAINANGALTITTGADGMTFSGNSAYGGGAIYAHDTLTITTDAGGMTFSGNSATGNGGAIYALDALTITTGAGGMTFSGNSANRGGAINANDALTITTGAGGMTFSGNSATLHGGAIYANGALTLGKGITFGLADTSTTGNSAGNGGAIYFMTNANTLDATAGQVGFYHNKATDSGGAIYADGALTITTGAGGMTFRGNSATGQDGGSGSGGGGAIYANGALTITTGAGGMTFSGNSAFLQGGAIYADDALTLGKKTTFGLADTSTTGNSANYGGAIYFTANANTLDATAGHVGFYHNKATFDGGAINANGALAITTGADGMTFRGNSATNNGGAINAIGALTLGKGITFGLNGDDTTGNSANYGGAISFSANTNTNTHTLTATAGQVGFYHNIASYNGGAIHAFGALTITTGADGMIFSGNSATLDGGAIYANGALTLGKGITFGLKDGISTGNSAKSGGAISFSANANTLDATAEHVGFYYNTATHDGGAIYAHDALTITTGADGMTFNGNSAGSIGGAIYANGALTLGKGITFGLADTFTASNNAGFGGAIYFSTNANTLTATAGHVGFYYNTATNDGSAIYADGALTITTGADGMTFSGNAATGDSSSGGAIYATDALSIGGNVLFANNSATDSGGAISADAGVTLNTGTTGDIHFTGNTANGVANAISMYQGQLALSGDRAVVFDDPIMTRTSSSVNTFTSTAKLAQFAGASTLSGTTGGGQATVSGTGNEFRVLSGGAFATGGTSSTASFSLETGAILSGAGKISTPGNITLAGIIDPTGNRYTPNSTSLSTAGSFSTGSDIATLSLEGGTVFLKGATLKINTAAGNVSDAISVTGNLNTAAGNNTVDVSGGYRKGKYAILDWSGSLTGNVTDFVLTGITLNSRQSADLSINGKTLLLTIDAFNKTLTWTGGTNTVWIDSHDTLNNWMDGTNTPTFFINGDTVVFDSTAATQNVSVDGGGVTVDAMTVSAAGYSFSGGSINGDTLTLNSPSASVTTFSNAIDFSGGITVAKGNTLAFNYGTDVANANTISGAGGLTKTGAGALTLANGLNRNAANAASAGDVTVNGGTLAIDGQGNFAKNVVVTSGATLRLAAGNTAALSAASLTFTGGSLDITGTVADSMTILTTANGVTGFNPANVTMNGNAALDYVSFSAELANSDKDIRVSSGLTWNMTDGSQHGTFTLADASDSFTLGQALDNKAPNGATSWNGQSLTKKGAGALILTGANTYTGNTDIQAGTLQIGNGGTTGSIASRTASVASGATLAFNRSDAVSYSGAISGAGSLLKQGAGALTLTGANTYSGGTTVDEGVLRLADARASGTGKIAIALDAALELAFTGTLGNAVTGGGDLVADAGSGTVILAGANTYTGMTTVKTGTLGLGSDLTTSSGLEFYGGTAFAANGRAHSLDGKTLTVRGEGSTYDGNLHARNATMNFITPGNATGSMLNVTGTAALDGSRVNLGVSGNTELATGTTLSLLKAAGGLTGAVTQGDGAGILKVGATVVQGITLATTADELTATIGGGGNDNNGGSAAEGAKALSEGYLASVGLALHGADLVAGQGMNAAAQATLNSVGTGTNSSPEDSGGYGAGGFVATSGGSVRSNTGSHVDMNSMSVLTGLALGADLAPGRLTVGAFFEYGNGSYDTHNSFSNAASVDGDGNTWYMGGGVLGRMDFKETGPGHIYTEGSARTGRLHNDYTNSDLRDSQGRKADYDTSSNYYSLHLGTGYVWTLTEKASLDLHAKYFWTRQEGDGTKLSTGESVRFKDVDSHRLRTGTRFAYAVNNYVAPYIGAAWEHEFDSKAKATTNGHAIAAPDMKGGTGIGELGLSVKPSQTLPLTFDLGVQGYTGKREGVTGSLQVKWEF